MSFRHGVPGSHRGEGGGTVTAPPTITGVRVHGVQGLA